MSQIYIHYTDKTLVLDSSENLMYPLLGSLLRWDNLRVAFALSLTQSQTDNNAGFTAVETLPMVSAAPILNRVSIGLKSRGLELPGEATCSFAGFSNPTASNGSSLGFVSDIITLSTKDVITYPVTLAATGVGGYNITDTPDNYPLGVAYNDQGFFYDLPVGQQVNFNGKVAQIAAPLSNGATSVSLRADPSVNVLNADRFGTAKSTQVFPSASLGCICDANGNQFTSSSISSQGLLYPASFVMQGSSNYATILVMDFTVTNRGLSTQKIKVGYQVTPNIGDTSIESLQAFMASYVPTLESATFNFNTAMPTCLFVRWPFQTTRLRIHSIAAKKF